MILFSILLLFACTADTSGKNEMQKSDIKKFDLPIYIGAKNVKPYTLKDGLIKGISYDLKLPYPGASDVVLQWYDTKLKQKGYVPFVEEYYKYADRVWQEFIDGTMKGEPRVAQLTSSWVDTNKTERINLTLRYYWYPDCKTSKIILESNDNLHVDIQIIPFVTLPPPMEIPKNGER